MVARLAALIGVLAAVSACSVSPTGATPEYPEGTSVHSLDVSGLARSYRVYKPAGLPVSAPLVVMLHGGFGSAEQAERSYGWDQLADAAKFVVAYPDGVAAPGTLAAAAVGARRARASTMSASSRPRSTTWPRRSASTRRASMPPVSATAASWPTGWRATPRSSLPSAGFGDATGYLPLPHPTSVMHIHGTADTRIRYGGGEGDGVARINGPPVADVNAFWRNVDQCAAPAVNTSGALTTSSADCPDGRSVVLITVDGGGHQWPPFATQTFWQFFAAHSR
ncbi:esterase PHB depolymerase family protein [Mycobacterium xenopi 4042]|uniref:Esterase PHB depolymerase family protein n=1 Tax=Mycobacterium xenopi 4042 TaxID=1299334 RepID=X7YK32_MYCXE|nr:esterase PHB depolymerase family protein [Mycobacterium xenopi 4042]